MKGNGPNKVQYLDHPLFEYMRDGVAVYQIESGGGRKLLECNASFARMSGRSKGELQALDDIGRVQGQGVDQLEDTRIQETFQTGSPYVTQYSWIRPDDEENIIESQTLIVPTRDGDRLFSIDHDITDQKNFEDFMSRMRDTLEQKVQKRTFELVKAREEAEHSNTELRVALNELEDAHSLLKNAQSQLVMQEKLASVGQLAAGIAHELNSPIGYLSGNFEALATNVGKFYEVIEHYHGLVESSDSHEKFKQLVEGVQEHEKTVHLDFLLEDSHHLYEESKEGFRRINGIVDSIREFSHIDKQQNFVMFDINKEVHTTIKMARPVLKSTVDIQLELGVVPTLRGIPDQINQVLLNLIINASHAIKDSAQENGVIVIHTDSDRDFLYCYITDNGPGIPDDHLTKIFDPFFTTKDPGDGTGLGLSISYDIIVNRHGGKLSAANMDVGCTFTIALPLKEKKNG